MREGVRVIVYHASYGCDTGCCGHVVEMRDSDDKFVKRGQFEFMPPNSDEDKLEWARRLVVKEFGAEHVDDLDWENCHVLDIDSC